jgi:crotonobetainyl-CoA:carnitine CoA-transferase CaiB-like acyl-CoA transferase
MLALLARERTGVGQAIEVTMMQANAWANADEAFDYDGRPGYVLPDAECYGLNALYRLYKSAEGWVFLACLNDSEWEAFCAAVGRGDLLADSRFASAAVRKKHDDELAAEITRVFSSRPAPEWERTLTAAGVACVQADVGVGDFLEKDSHAIANRLAVEVDSPRYGKYLRHGAIVNFSDAPTRLGPGAFGGEHTTRITRELGYTEEQVADLRSRHIIH